MVERQGVPDGSAVWGGEERRLEGGARTRALRHLTHGVCSNAANEVSVVSYAVRPQAEHRSGVGAKRRPPQPALPAGTPWRDALLLASLLAVSSFEAQAGSLRYCDNPPTLSAAQQDRLLQVSGILRRELEATGSSAAIVARSGLNLRWFDMRYSHAGISLKASAATPWAVRQLYFSCDEKAPRLFDQGLSAFLLGTEDADHGFISIVTLPAEAAERIAPVALDNGRALSLLGATYSANAYAWSTQYQNCNQWLAELLGLAWSTTPAWLEPRTGAQQWLKAQGYEPGTFSVGWRPLLWLTALSPYLNRDDHPEHDLAQAQFRVSMPESIASFVRTQAPAAPHVELCHTREHVVIRRGWVPLAAACVPGDGDTVIPLD